MNSHILGIIPARLASTRLPDKPLHPILGRPLVEWVWMRVRSMGVLDRVVVATDSEAVVDACRAMGARVELTSPDHPSGTDRVAEVARRNGYGEFGVIANIQGDEPLLKEAHLESAVRLVRDEGWDVGTCAAPLLEAGARADPNVVKVARARSGKALYFSRAPIPYPRDGEPTREQLSGDPFLRHVGIYTYTRDALERWVDQDPTPLERIEKLEQLRALESGLEIGVAVVDAAEPGVDTPEDVKEVEARLAGHAWASNQGEMGDENEMSRTMTIERADRTR